MLHEETKLVLGRGEVYFEPFLAGTRAGEGERYIGNTTGFQITRSLERLERYQSFKGQKIKGQAAILSESHSVNFITDNISIENVGLWYGAEGSDVTSTAVSQVTENFKIQSGRFYQLGRSISPYGSRGVENVQVRLVNVPVAASNYEIDLVRGRLRILPDAPDLVSGMTITVDFDTRNLHSDVAVSAAKDVFGALRFIATGIVGPQYNFFLPYVRLSPRGSVDLKGDEWQQIPFEVEALRLNSSMQQIYIDAITFVGLTEDEEAIVDVGDIDLSAFPNLEDIVNNLTNVEYPGIIAMNQVD